MRAHQVILAIVLASLPACGASSGGNADAACSGYVVEPALLTLTDHATGGPICDATLEGDSGAVLTRTDLNVGTCAYDVSPSSATRSPTDTAVQFSVTILATGYAKTTVMGLEVRYCECPGDCQARAQSKATLTAERDGG